MTVCHVLSWCSFSLVVHGERPGLHFFPPCLDSLSEESKILNGIPQTSLPASPPNYPTDTPALARPPNFPRAFLTLHFVLAFPFIVILVLEIPLQRSPLSRNMFLNSLGWFRALPSWTSMHFSPLSWSHLVIGL